MRWLPYEQAERAIHMPLLVVVVSWLAIMFISVGLYAPLNAASHRFRVSSGRIE